MYCHIFMNHSVLCTLFNLSRGDLEQANAPELLYYGDKTTRQFRRCCVADQAAGLRSCRKMAQAFTVYKYAFAADSGPPFDGCLGTLYLDVCSASTVINDTFRLLQCESKKGCHPIHGYNFVNSSSICKILSLL